MLAVERLSGAEIDRRISAEIGDAALAAFAGMVRARHPGDGDPAVAQKVHLMVLAYLMRGELEGMGAQGG
jgi:hypothetical protein